MNTQSLIYFTTVLFCAVVFIAISLWCFNSKKPVNFWAGEKIPSDFVSDVKKYNQANGIMWLIYGLCWVPAALTGLFNIGLGAAMVVILCLGIGVLIFIQAKIRKRYFK